MKICFLASGGGGNLKFLYLAQELSIMQNIKLFVIADRECNSIEFAKKHKIYNKVIKYNQNNNKVLLDELAKIDADIIVTNWHKIIDKEVVNKYLGKLINLHYSLLPAFGGLIGTVPIEEAYKNGCQYVGATCHYVDHGVDTGKIIAQAVVKTDIEIEYAIQEVFKKCCLILLNSILLISSNNCLMELKDNNKFDFSPSLKFDDLLFDKSFWDRLSKV